MALIDPQLRSQIAKADAAHPTVAATFTLRNSARGLRSPQETQRVVQRILERCQAQTKVRPKGFNVFENLQSFAVDAAPDFVQALLNEPEIESATANEQSDDLLIRPVDVHEVSAEA